MTVAKGNKDRYSPVMRMNPTTHPVLLSLVLLAALLGGCAGSHDPYSRRYTALDINPNPAILNSAIVKGTDLSNLRLENVVIKDATFLNTTSRGAFFKNVVFDNCRFINAKFDKTVLDRVMFKGGIITCENDPHNIKRRTAFTNSRFTSLVLDGTYIENAQFSGADSSITIKNSHGIIASQPIILGKNIQITLERSYFRLVPIGLVTGSSTLAASNCRFEYSNFGESTFTKTSFSRNIVLGGPVYAGAPSRPSRSRTR